MCKRNREREAVCVRVRVIEHACVRDEAVNKCASVCVYGCEGWKDR